MQATMTTVPTSSTSSATAKPMLWAGRVVSALPVLFLIFDGVIKLMNIQPVVDASMQLGLPLELAPKLGVLLLACLVVYLIPRTSALGAVLLTGYLGGAIAIQARVGAETFSLVFPIIMGALLWVGLWLRDERVRAMVAIRR
jgi:hypothetical protein